MPVLAKLGSDMSTDLRFLSVSLSLSGAENISSARRLTSSLGATFNNPLYKLHRVGIRCAARCQKGTRGVTRRSWEISGARRARWLSEDAEGVYGVGEAREDVEAAFMLLKDIMEMNLKRVEIRSGLNSTDKKSQPQVKE